MGRLPRECQESKVELALDMVAPVSIKGGNVTISGSYPQVMAICTNCGHTRYFSTIVLGLPPLPDSADDPNPTADLLKKKRYSVVQYLLIVCGRGKAIVASSESQLGGATPAADCQSIVSCEITLGGNRNSSGVDGPRSLR